MIPTDVPCGDRHDLHEPARARVRDDLRIELAFLANDGEQQGALRRLAERLVLREGMHGVGVGVEVHIARDAGLADTHGHLVVADRIGEMGEHRDFGLALQRRSQMRDDDAGDAAPHIGMVREHGRTQQWIAIEGVGLR